MRVNMRAFQEAWDLVWLRLQEIEHGVHPYILPAQVELLHKLRYMQSGFWVVQDAFGVFGGLGVEVGKCMGGWAEVEALIVSGLYSSEANVPSIDILGNGVSKVLVRMLIVFGIGLQLLV